jgi:hypothetical protein
MLRKVSLNRKKLESVLVTCSEKLLLTGKIRIPVCDLLRKVILNRKKFESVLVTCSEKLLLTGKN